MPRNSQSFEATLREATRVAKSKSHGFVVAEHLLLAALSDLELRQALAEFSDELDRCKADARLYVDNDLQGLVARHVVDPKPNHILAGILTAVQLATPKDPRGTLTSLDALLVMLENPRLAASKLLEKHGLSTTVLGENSLGTERHWVFISHANADKSRLEPLLVELAQRFSILIDRPDAVGLGNHPYVKGIEPSEPWRASLEAMVIHARCAVVFWSKAAIARYKADSILRAEVDRSRADGKLVHAVVEPRDGLVFPFGITEDQILDVDLDDLSRGGLRPLRRAIERTCAIIKNA